MNFSEFLRDRCREVERRSTGKSELEKAITPLYYMLLLESEGRKVRMDLSTHISILMQHNLLDKLRYVSLNDSGSGGSGLHKDLGVEYWFDSSLTFEEYCACDSLYAPCAFWMQSTEKFYEKAQEEYKEIQEDIGPEDFICFESKGVRKIEAGSYKVFTLAHNIKKLGHLNLKDE